MSEKRDTMILEGKDQRDPAWRGRRDRPMDLEAAKTEQVFPSEGEDGPRAPEGADQDEADGLRIILERPEEEESRPEGDEPTPEGDEPAPEEDEPASEEGGSAPEEDPGEPGPEADDWTSREGFKDIPRKRKVHRKKHPLVRLLIVAGVVIGCAAFLLSPVFNVRDIQVEGNRYYSDSEVINMANVRTGVNLFRGVDGADVKRRLLTNPYFTGVKVRRRPFGTLILQVTERQQRAALRYGEDYIVIDDDGIVLRRTSVNPKLTLLNGLTLSRIQTGKKVEAEESEMLSMTLSMLSAMKKGDFYFTEIEISRTQMTASITDTLKVRGNPDRVKAAIKKGDLQKVVNRLFKSGVKRGTITVSESSYMSFSPAI